MEIQASSGISTMGRCKVARRRTVMEKRTSRCRQVRTILPESAPRVIGHVGPAARRRLMVSATKLAAPRTAFAEPARRRR
jgi:hypothetical protein